MKKITLLVAILSFVAGARPLAQGAVTAGFTPVRLQVVLSRYEGEKKTASMPNTLWANVPNDPKEDTQAYSVIGVQVPIHVVANNTTTVAYKDVGNRIDCKVATQPDNRFLLRCHIGQETVDRTDGGGQAGNSPGPILRAFSTRFSMVLRDGQTVQPTSVTDPISGEVLKIDVTLNVVK